METPSQKQTQNSKQNKAKAPKARECIFFFLFYFTSYLFMCGWVGALVCRARPVGGSQRPTELVLSCYHVDPGDWIQFFRVGSKCLYRWVISLALFFPVNLRISSSIFWDILIFMCMCACVYMSCICIFVCLVCVYVNVVFVVYV